MSEGAVKRRGLYPRGLLNGRTYPRGLLNGGAYIRGCLNIFVRRVGGVGGGA